jgi:hypothetical protein
VVNTANIRPVKVQLNFPFHATSAAHTTPPLSAVIVTCAAKKEQGVGKRWTRGGLKIGKKEARARQERGKSEARERQEKSKRKAREKQERQEARGKRQEAQEARGKRQEARGKR